MKLIEAAERGGLKMSKPDGGPAFPFNRIESECYSGMSLRDYFAAATLQAILANSNNHYQNFDGPEKFTIAAFEYADAMLAQRNK